MTCFAQIIPVTGDKVPAVAVVISLFLCLLIAIVFGRKK